MVLGYGLSDDVHFVDEVLGVGVFVDDEEHVTAVETDAALQVFFEVDVATHGFTVAVEGEADEVAIGVEDGGAAVATGDVVIGDEAGGKLSLGVGVGAEVLGGIEVFEPLWDDEFGVVGVFFLHDTFEGGVVVVGDAVAWVVGFNVAVGEADGAVGVGRHQFLAGVDLEDAVDEVAGTFGEVVAALFRQGEVGIAVFVEDVAAVFVDFVAFEFLKRGVFEEFFEGFLIGEDRVTEEVGNEGSEVATEFAVGGFEAVGDVVDVDVAVGVFHHGGHDALFNGFVVVFVEVGAVVHEVGEDGFALVGVGFFKEGFDLAGEDSGLVEQFRTFEKTFVEVGDGFLEFTTVGIAFLNQRKGVAVFGVFVESPVVILFLDFFFEGHGVEFLQCDVLFVAVFPVVGASGVLRGVFDFDGLVFIHFLAEDVDFDGAEFVAEFVSYFHGFFEAVGGEEVRGGAGEAENHGEVAVLEFTGADGEVVFGFEGDVFLGVGSGFAVGGGVDAEHGEVAGVARPGPVVGVAAEFAHRRGGSAHESDILVDDVDEEEVLVAVEHGFDGSIVVGALDGFVDDAVADVANGFSTVVLAHVVAEAFEDALGDIFHTDEDGSGEAGVGEFLRHVVGPEAVAEIVVFDGGVLLEFAVATVVVGGDKTFVGDDLTSAEVPEGAAFVAEADDGVLDAVLVDGIDVFRREFETGFLHVGIVLADEREEPHALVGAAGSGSQDQHGQCQGKDDFFHAKNIS